MYRDYPLQQHARNKTLHSQSAFARRAKLILQQPRDYALQISAGGLMLLAKNEEALHEPVAALKLHFGGGLQFDAPEVRLIGTPPHEPIMTVRINVPVARIEAVKRHLEQRSIDVFDESHGGTRCLLYGEAPLRRLLGLDNDLQCITLRSALVWTALARYEPVDPEPIAA